MVSFLLCGEFSCSRARSKSVLANRWPEAVYLGWDSMAGLCGLWAVTILGRIAAWFPRHFLLLDQPDCCGWVTEPLKHFYTCIDEFLGKTDVRCPKLLRLNQSLTC